jgi:hypothetical protein
VRAAGAAVPSALLSALERSFAGDGAVSNQVNLTSFGVLALRAVGAPLPPMTLGWLLRQQNGDGGFSFATAGGGSDVDDTAAALEALAAAGGAPGASTARAVGFIRSHQNPDGGFATQGAGDSNAQSTAWAIQGLIATGVDPASVHRPGGASPLDYLTSLIAPDGHVRYSRGADQTPVWVTAEAAMALDRKPLPLRPARAARAPSRHHAALSRRAKGARQANHLARPRRQAISRHRTHARAPAAPTNALAADAAVATALALAPLGMA